MRLLYWYTRFLDKHGNPVYPAPKTAAARGLNRTSAAHLTAHGLPDIISTAHIV